MPTKSNTGAYTVNVIDVNERPSFATSVPLELSVAENVPAGTPMAVFAATDPDAGDVGQLRFSWRNPVSSAAGSPLFVVDPVSGALSTLGDIDYERIESHAMELRVTDSGGLYDTITVAIAIVNVNEPPTLLAGQVFSASEAWGAGVRVGSVSATDPDAGTQFVFNIMAGNLGAAFAIDSASGEITVSWDGALDFENIVVYSVNVRGAVHAVHQFAVGWLPSVVHPMHHAPVVDFISLPQHPSSFVVQVSVTDNGVPGDTRLFRDIKPVVIRITNVNDVAVTSFSGTTVLPTAGGGVTELNGVNLGRIAPLEDGTWGPLAVVSFGGFDG